jgi:phage protein U
MLMQLGALAFEVAPFNTHANDRQAAADYAAKDLLGRRRSREFVGEGDEKITIRGRLFPEVIGGLGGLAVLDAMRASGTAQPLVRGDGANLGWFVIEKVTEKSSLLGRQGIGRLIEFEIDLTRADPASGPDFLGFLFALFG